MIVFHVEGGSQLLTVGFGLLSSSGFGLQIP